MTPLAVIGMGLVTPLARTPASHAFFLRADVGAPSPGGFVDAQGETIAVAYCPWLGARLAVAGRLRELGRNALASALQPLAAQAKDGPPDHRTTIPVLLFVCTSAPRPGFHASDRAELEEEVTPWAEDRRCRRLTGEAGFFEGLVEASHLLQRGDMRAVVILATDSLVAPAYLAGFQRLSTLPWDMDLPRPSEGAAAVVVMAPAAAKRAGLEVLALISHAAVLRGEANDDNEAIVDGAALTALVRGIPGSGVPFGSSFGQHAVGSLRRREWEMAMARCASSFDATCALLSPEARIGCMGAASGAASFVHGAAVHRHRAWPWSESPGSGPFLAWAISPDGLRGLCAATVRG